MFWILISDQMCDLQMFLFSYLVDHLSTLLLMLFDTQVCVILMWSNLSTFCFTTSVFVVISKKSFPEVMNISPYFSSEFIFTFYIHVGMMINVSFVDIMQVFLNNGIK